MRILQANKFFSIRGGADKIFFETIAGLKKRGHTVIDFSMEAPGNLPSEYQSYFGPNVSLKTGGLGQKVSTAKFIFSSSIIEKKVTALLEKTKPEVAHLHNVYRELSASTFTVLRRQKIPTVLTVHDFFPLCPNHNFMVGDSLGEEKLRGSLWRCVRYRCVNNAFGQSVLGALEARYYRFKKIWQGIDMFICPSEFVREKMLEYGFPGHKLVVLPYPCEAPTTVPPLGDKIVFLGRLHPEKGIKQFCEAAKNLPQFPVLIVGSGPEEKWVKTFIARHALKNIELRPWVPQSALPAVFAEAKVVVAPSVFYETGCLSLIEAMGYARVVVGSNRGAIKDLIAPGKTGLLCAPEDAADLTRTIHQAMQLTPKQAERIGDAARKFVVKRHDVEGYFEGLEGVYGRVVKSY